MIAELRVQVVKSQVSSLTGSSKYVRKSTKGRSDNCN